MKGKLQSKAKRVLKKGTAIKKAQATKKSSISVKSKRSATASQKAPGLRAKSNNAVPKKPLVTNVESRSQFNQKNADPAHKPGHRKMNLKDELKEQSGQKVETKSHDALNSLTRGEQTRRNTLNMRRLIPGASIEKKGRV